MICRPHAIWLACLILAAVPPNVLAGAKPAHRTFAPPASGHRLIVVADRGGVSALPYYRAIHLLPERNTPSQGLPSPPPASRIPYSERDFLPVRSVHLTPGRVRRRVLAAPRLTPLCLVGDDTLSRAWIQKRLSILQRLHAVCLVVEVASYRAFQALGQLAPGIPLEPVSGDDIARRLDLHHYPVLITARGLEQ